MVCGLAAPSIMDGGLRTSQLDVSNLRRLQLPQGSWVADPIRIGNLHRNEDLRAPEVHESPLAPEAHRFFIRYIQSSSSCSRGRTDSSFCRMSTARRTKTGRFRARPCQQAADEQAFRQTFRLPPTMFRDSGFFFTTCEFNSRPDTINDSRRRSERTKSLTNYSAWPGVAVKQDLKQLLKRRVVCDACGNLLHGCFAPDFGTAVAVKTVDEDHEIDFLPSPPERPIAEAEEPRRLFPLKAQSIVSPAKSFRPASGKRKPIITLPISARASR